MRLYPVAPLIARDLRSEVQIGECEREYALARLHVAREIAHVRASAANNCYGARHYTELMQSGLAEVKRSPRLDPV